MSKQIKYSPFNITLISNQPSGNQTDLRSTIDISKLKHKFRYRMARSGPKAAELGIRFNNSNCFCTYMSGVIFGYLHLFLLTG